jgi:hypothetical protein
VSQYCRAGIPVCRYFAGRLLLEERKLMRRLFPSMLALLSSILVFAWSTPSIADKPSAADCAAEADRASRDVGSGLGGVGRGAAKGAIFGAIVGDNSKSARRGAALGAVIGGVRSGAEKNSVYESVYDACMRRS